MSEVDPDAEGEGAVTDLIYGYGETAEVVECRKARRELYDTVRRVMGLDSGAAKDVVDALVAYLDARDALGRG